MAQDDSTQGEPMQGKAKDAERNAYERERHEADERDTDTMLHQDGDDDEDDGQPLDDFSRADSHAGVHADDDGYDEDADEVEQDMHDWGGLEPDTSDPDVDDEADLSEMDTNLPIDDPSDRFEKDNDTVDEEEAAEPTPLRTRAPSSQPTTRFAPSQTRQPTQNGAATPSSTTTDSATTEPATTDASPTADESVPHEKDASTRGIAGGDRSQGVSEEASAEVSADGFLEEVTYPSTTDSRALELGTSYTWGAVGFTVDKVLTRGWYKASATDGAALLVRPHPTDIAWDTLPQHRRLPKVRYHGDDGFALEWTPGEPLTPPLSLADSLAYLVDLVQLVRFFEAQGWALVDLAPDGLLTTDDGLKLRYPPRLAKIGEPLPDSVYRQGYTPPEVSRGSLATGREGVYLLSALLVYLYSGETLPAEGVSMLDIRRYREPGLPQLLFAGLSSRRERPSPEAFMALVRALQRPAPPAFELAAATTVGLNPERAVNEDSYGYVQEIVESVDEPVQLIRACVADGMGGEEAGEVASQAAVKAFCGAKQPHPLDDVSEQANWNKELVWQANAAVLQALSGSGGGCTFTSVLVFGTRLTLGHVGDSRAYLYLAEDDAVQMLSLDHSLVRALVANGMLTEEEAAVSPDRNKVLRSLGSVRQPQERYVDGLEPALDRPSLDLAVGDVVLLMSDGICGEVEASVLDQTIRNHHTEPQTLADALIDAALDRGANDNATVVIVRRSR